MVGMCLKKVGTYVNNGRYVCQWELASIIQARTELDSVVGVA